MELERELEKAQEQGCIENPFETQKREEFEEAFAVYLEKEELNKPVLVDQTDEVKVYAEFGLYFKPVYRCSKDGKLGPLGDCITEAYARWKWPTTTSGRYFLGRCSESNSIIFDVPFPYGGAGWVFGNSLSVHSRVSGQIWLLHNELDGGGFETKVKHCVLELNRMALLQQAVKKLSQLDLLLRPWWLC